MQFDDKLYRPWSLFSATAESTLFATIHFVGLPVQFLLHYN